MFLKNTDRIERLYAKLGAPLFDGQEFSPFIMTERQGLSAEILPFLALLGKKSFSLILCEKELSLTFSVDDAQICAASFLPCSKASFVNFHVVAVSLPSQSPNMAEYC